MSISIDEGTAMQALHALAWATRTHIRRPDSINGPRGAGEPNDCTCKDCAAVTRLCKELKVSVEVL